MSAQTDELRHCPRSSGCIWCLLQPGGASSQCLAEVSDAPNFEDVVVGAVGVAEVADAGAGAAGFDGGFTGWVPHDHHVPDVVGSEIGVPEDQVACSLLAGSDSDAIPGSEPTALRGG